MHGEPELCTLASFETLSCIFVHVPRTGGFALAKSLFGNAGGSHITVRQYREIFDHEFSSYFKFAIVRNPFDRLVSAYRYIMDGGGKVQHDLAMQRKIRPYGRFSDFVRSCLVPSELKNGIHPPGLPEGDARQASKASSESQTVRSPRLRSPASYSPQFFTRYRDFACLYRRRFGHCIG